MDKYIVYSKDLTKADTLILKNLEADIKDVLNKPASASDDAKGESLIHDRNFSQLTL